MRALHVDTDDLVWDDGLSAWAYDYVESLTGTTYDPCSGNLIHSSNRNNQGENIGFATTTDPSSLIDAWYNEIEYYDYNNITGIEHDGQEVGHFTQVVWASTTSVGCAVVQCDTMARYGQNATYLLCEYSPAGNVYDETPGDYEFVFFEENVKELKSSN